MKYFLQTILVLSWCAAGPLGAQHRATGPGMMRRPPAPRPERANRPRPLEELQRMSPEERRRAIEKLPPERQRKLEERLERYNQMSPEQRERLRERYERFHQLPPERQEAMRQAFRDFTKLPQERQQIMRQEMRQLREMPEGERKQYMDGPEFRGRFDDNERRILEEMSATLPPS